MVPQWVRPAGGCGPTGEDDEQAASLSGAGFRRTRLEQIRQDIPGTSGWAGTVTELAESLDDDEFDPELYLVACRRSDGAYVGLIRVWNRSPHPRVGCLGVIASLRRTSLSSRLVLAVGEELLSRGVEAVTTETDMTNNASHTLVRRMGGEPTQVTADWEYSGP